MESYPFHQFRATSSSAGISLSGDDLRPIAHASISLYTNVTNSKDLRKRLVEVSMMEGEAGDKARNEMDYALIEGSLISSRSHILTAIYAALQAQTTGTLKTKTVHSEILLGLNMTNNITDAIKRFGVSETTTQLMVVRISYHHPIRTEAERETDEQEMADQLDSLVEGEMVSLDELEAPGGAVDWQRLKKVYKLNDVALPKGASTSSPKVLSIYRSIIVSSIAGKPVLL